MPRPRVIDHSRVLQLYKKLRTTIAVAKELNVSTCAINKILKLNNIEIIAPQGHNPSAKASAEFIINHILKNGGTLPEAIESLGLSVSEATVRKYAKEKGIDLYQYKFMGTTVGPFVVERPGWSRINGTIYVPMKCLECGAETMVPSRAFTKSMNHTCKSCGARRYTDKRRQTKSGGMPRRISYSAVVDSYKQLQSQTQVADELGISQSSVSRILQVSETND
jgi:DNA-directed RNA polymerase subunit RPC12/RpoP